MDSASSLIISLRDDRDSLQLLDAVPSTYVLILLPPFPRIPNCNARTSRFCVDGRLYNV